MVSSGNTLGQWCWKQKSNVGAEQSTHVRFFFGSSFSQGGHLPKHKLHLILYAVVICGLLNLYVHTEIEAISRIEAQGSPNLGFCGLRWLSFPGVFSNFTLKRE